MKKSSLNATGESLAEYLRIFHAKIVEASDIAIPEELRNQVWHYSLSKMKILGYVSTSFGLGWEYIENGPPGIDVIIGSKRIEDLVADTPSRYVGAKPTMTISTDRNLIVEESRFWDGPIRKASSSGSLELRNCHFRFGDRVKSVFKAELFFDRRAHLWTPEVAMEKASREVLAASYDIILAAQKGKSLAEYIGDNKRKLVLILGSYSEEGKKRLNKIAAVIKAYGYEPIMLSDIKDDPHQNLRQKVTALGSLARFVIMDDSERSGHLNEIEICRFNEWFTSILRLDGKPSTAMSMGNSLTSKVMSEYAFNDHNLEAVIKESIDWSENLAEELKSNMDLLYPWRST